MDTVNFSKPHDRFFRQYFGEPGTLVPLLEMILPDPVRSNLDFSGLSIDPGTYVDGEHKDHFADIALTVPICGEEKKKKGCAGVYSDRA
jgi:hypothetical protein